MRLDFLRQLTDFNNIRFSMWFSTNCF
ncbi:MAG: hypothetical protein CFH41_02442, partial [Alphaproteobacteria bacterium MarineAlpha11_Bin1]